MPSLQMASSSSSSLKHWIYDVFLSFRGPDTRRGFTAHLHKALKDEKVKVFIDNELRKGEDITDELVQAIQGSRISLIVFSRRYAESSWCLGELVQIMECRRTLGQIVFPIFYDVGPSHARYQIGGFADAFQKHEKRYQSDLDKVVRWRSALTEAANLSGWDLTNPAEGTEAEVIPKIVDNITRHLENTYLDVAVYPVAVEARMQDISDYLDVELNDVRVVGIWGMGGMGKTTVAKAIYNKLYHSFGGKSFLANVRETAKEKNGKILLQEMLLSDILKPTKIEIDNADRGINMIKDKLGCEKVLVIVDDVDHVDQLNALAINRDAFGPGSRVVVTTRDRHLLEQLEVHKIYEVQKMSEEEALELFSRHAFRNRCPNEEFIELSRSVVAYCGGLPLALQVLGSFMFNRTISDWKSTMKQLKKIPHDEIQKKLRLSFDQIDDNQKGIFLHISCFFIGMDRNYVTKILDSCDFCAGIGISVLIERCLATVSEKNKLMMHDLLRDMGREIVRAKFPNSPGKCSRLWRQEDVIEVLTENSGTKRVEGLALNLRTSDQARFSTKAFTNMKRLTLLQLSYVRLTGNYKYLSKKLSWLCWRGFPLKFIPKDFFKQLQNLVYIDLRYSNLVQFWADSRLLKKLTILNLSHSHYLTQLPDFSELPNLEYLILKDCKRLSEVHHSIGNLQKLALVNLKDCKMLKNLPRSFWKVKSLKTLVLSGCSTLEVLDDEIRKMESLTTLLMPDTTLGNILSSIDEMKNLTYVSVRSTLRSLRTLSLKDCNLTDDAIPFEELSHLSSLRELNLECNRFHSLPSLRNVSYLQSLYLNNCTSLHAIGELPTSLRELYVNHCPALERMPNFSEMSNMRSMVLSHSPKLNDIPGLDKSLSSMTLIQMESCTSLTSAFKESILKGWTASGVGGISLPGDDIPEWFAYVKESDQVFFQVPQRIGCNLKVLTVCFVYSCFDEDISPSRISIFVKNHTKLISFVVWRAHPTEITCHEVIWLGNLSNIEFNLEGGDYIEVEIDIGSGFRVKKTGVGLVWDPKFINENTIKCESIPNDYSFSYVNKEAGPSHDSSDEVRTFKRLRFNPSTEMSRDQRICRRES